MTTDLAKLGGYLAASGATEFDALMRTAVAELRKLRDDVAVLRCYAKHDQGCDAGRLAGRASVRSIGGISYVIDNPPPCTCGLDDVLRAVDAQPPKLRERGAEWFGC